MRILDVLRSVRFPLALGLAGCLLVGTTGCAETTTSTMSSRMSRFGAFPIDDPSPSYAAHAQKNGNQVSRHGYGFVGG